MTGFLLGRGGGLAESVAQYLEKGRRVVVSGRLELDEWETDAGERRSGHNVIAAEVEFLGRRPEGRWAALRAPPGASGPRSRF